MYIDTRELIDGSDFAHECFMDFIETLWVPRGTHKTDKGEFIMAKVTPIKFVPPGPCRLSYVNLFEPAPAMNPGDTPVRQVSLLFPKTDAASIGMLADNLRAIMTEGLKVGFFKSEIGLHVPMRDGDVEVAAENRGPEYAGMYFMNAKSWRPVGIVDGQNQPILDPEELYSGCWANVQITYKAFDRNGKKGVRVEINLVQKVKDDERFDGVDAAAKVFGVVDTPATPAEAVNPMAGITTPAPATPAPAEVVTQATQALPVTDAPAVVPEKTVIPGPAGSAAPNPFANLV